MAVYTKESLKEIIDFYFVSYPQITDYYSIAKYFFYPETKEELQVVRRDPFFYYTANSSWAMVVLDLCKIFSQSKNQKYNLFKVLNSLLTEPENKDILDALSRDFVTENITVLNSMTPTIEKLETLRNKFYAHLDDLSLNLITLDNPTFVETERLFDIIELIVSEIGSKVYDADYLFRDYDRVNAPSILKDVINQRKM